VSRRVEPKPFTYVDLADLPRKSRYVTQNSFLKNHLTGSLELVFEVVSDYFFVGSGGYDYSDQKKLVYYTFMRSGDQIVVPGSSIKGAVRSVAEAISNSCLRVISRNETGFRPRTHQDCNFEVGKNETLCPCCGLFGTTGYAGRVNFSDAPPIEHELEIVKIFELFGPRIIKRKRKFYQNKQFNPVGNLRPEKNYRFVEAAKKGSRFKTNVRFFNITKDEFSLLLHAMGLNQDYQIKLGGAKPRCFGTVKFIPTRLLILDEENPLKYEEKEGEDLSRFLSESLKSKGLILGNLLDQFRRGVAWLEEPCPKEVY